jgi:hypothetical protein
MKNFQKFPLYIIEKLEKKIQQILGTKYEQGISGNFLAANFEKNKNKSAFLGNFLKTIGCNG